jgi:hypothetical protein
LLAVNALHALLDEYRGRVEALGASVTDRLRAAANLETLAAADAAFGVTLHPDLRAWFSWSDGVAHRFASRSQEDPADRFLPWAQHLSIAEALTIVSELKPLQDDLREWQRSKGTYRTMHLAGFPLLSNVEMLFSVECIHVDAPGIGAGHVWVNHTEDPTMYIYPSIADVVQRALTFADRGWLVSNQFGGVDVAPAATLQAWTDRVGLRNPPPRAWITMSQLWGYDPVTDTPPRPWR